MLTYILVGVAVVILLLLILVSTRPPTFKVSRSASIVAPAQAVFQQVNDFHNWEAWSPWAKMDPDAKNVFSGSPAGTGAGFSWSGNSKVGSGSMTITDSRPSEQIIIRLQFEKPFKATNTAEFQFKMDNDRTQVTWTMTGKNNFMGKLFSMIVNCDKMIGGQFDQGLSNIKSIAEATATK